MVFKTFFYKDKNGKSPVKSYIDELSNRNDKNSRIKLTKIYEYIKYLCIVGRQAGEPYIKHLDGDIWELRPLKDRVLFAAWDKESFILLHHFVKKTKKTPKKEIERAKRNLADYKKRGKDND